MARYQLNWSSIRFHVCEKGSKWKGGKAQHIRFHSNNNCMQNVETDTRKKKQLTHTHSKRPKIKRKSLKLIKHNYIE